MTFPSATLRRTAVALITFALLSSGCQALGLGETPVPPTATAAPTEAPTPIPTDAAGRIILAAPASVAPARVEAIQPILEELAGQSGFAFEVRTDIPTGVVAGNWKAVFLLGSLPNQDELAASASGTQFIAFDGVDMQPAANVSFLKVNPSFRAFMAGYIGSLVAPDWRVGGLLPADHPELEDAFLNGGQYWCGRCAPVNPPYAAFPTVQSLPADSTPLAWQGAVTELMKVNTEVLYVSPEASSSELLISLGGLNFAFVGSQTPPDQVREKWIATLTQDVGGALRTAWPEWMAGTGGKVYDVPLQVTDINEYYLSPGKVRLIDETLAGLSSGLISPFSVEEQ